MTINNAQVNMQIISAKRPAISENCRKKEYKSDSNTRKSYQTKNDAVTLAIINHIKTAKHNHRYRTKVRIYSIKHEKSV